MLQREPLHGPNGDSVPMEKVCRQKPERTGVESLRYKFVKAHSSELRTSIREDESWFARPYVAQLRGLLIVNAVGSIGLVTLSVESQALLCPVTALSK